LLVGVVVVLAAGAGITLWAQALSAPVHRSGLPTTSVTPPPPKPTTASPSPSEPTPSASEPGASEEPTEPGGTMKASGKFATAGVERAPASSSGRRYDVAVAVETSSGLKADKVAARIAEVLNDPRSWAGAGEVRFGLVADPDAADLTIYLAAPKTAAKRCTVAAGTCAADGQVVIDAQAWTDGAAAFAGDADGFRRYLVNHGIGQFLDEPAAKCRKGEPAPVMLDQTGELKGCTPNPWPFP
jgi:hypothetical protein